MRTRFLDDAKCDKGIVIHTVVKIRVRASSTAIQPLLQKWLREGSSFAGRLTSSNFPRYNVRAERPTRYLDNTSRLGKSGRIPGPFQRMVSQPCAHG